MCCPRIHFISSECVIISPLRTLSKYINDPTSNRFHDVKQFDKFDHRAAIMTRVLFW